MKWSDIMNYNNYNYKYGLPYYIESNKKYNYIPIKKNNDHDVTFVVIKNVVNGEVEYENEYGERKIMNSNVQPKGFFTKDEAFYISQKLGIDFNKEKFTLGDFNEGLNVELEHGRRDLKTNVTNDDPILTGKIALAHLNEFPDYYVRLKKLEEEAKAYWKNINLKNIPASF
jgi:hypothetical protein